MAKWNVNTVRVPLNEDCWLGINGVKSAFSGARYRTAIDSYVQRLRGAGIFTILDLHWSAPGAPSTFGQGIRDHYLRRLSATDVSVVEGTGGGVDAVVPLMLTTPSPAPVTVLWATRAGSALSGDDFVAGIGLATIPAGATSTAIRVAVTPDAIREGDESFEGAVPQCRRCRPRPGQRFNHDRGRRLIVSLVRAGPSRSGSTNDRYRCADRCLDRGCVR